MLSRLDNIIKNTLRHAETTDTRQDIKRHEARSINDKNNKKRKKKTQDELWEDETIVSIPALLTFLKSLIKMQTQSTAAGPDNSIDNSSNSSSLQQADKNKPSAKAAQAYQNTARSSHKSSEPISHHEHLNSEQNVDLVLSTEEQRHIHLLIEDLNALYNQGHENLRIIKDGSFLDSIVSSVALFKSKI
jgi:hypothetical protein